MTVLLRPFVILVVFMASTSSCAEGMEVSGYTAGELRVFPYSPLSREQLKMMNLSLVLEPEFYHEWNDGNQRVIFIPFVRLDQHDSHRTHADIRECYWHRIAPSWELKIGVNKVFWGVTESQHLVDIINQTDLVEQPDQEEKLGQPMINLSLIRPWGTVDVFLLPYFRERTFPGRKGRLRTQPVVDVDHAEYESDLEEKHVDWAARWFKSIGEFDIGISHFSGTSREPRLLPRVGESGEMSLIPYYDLIDQTSLDLQWTHGGWLWKLEALNRFGQGHRFAAFTGGFEYTFVGVLNSSKDVGILAEFLFDEREEDAPTCFEEDVFLGTRLVMNDIHSTEVLIGMTFDPDSAGRLFCVEASRRIGERWKLDLEIRAFSDISESDPLAGLRRDDFLQLKLVRYF